MAAAVGPMNLTPASTQAWAKRGVLGEEAVAGMDGLGAAAAGDVEDLVDVQVGLAGGRRADVVGLVRLAHVERGAIDVGEDGDRADTHLAAGANHAHRDLTAIGDQDLLEHRSAPEIVMQGRARGRVI